MEKLDIAAARAEALRRAPVEHANAARAAITQLRKMQYEQRRRQNEEAIRYYTPHTQQLKFHSDEGRIRVILGGNRCIPPWQKIYDPILEGYRVVSEIDGPFHVYAFDGAEMVVAEAEQPFKKDEGEIYRLSLSDGQSFDCAGTHEILCADGVYRPVWKLDTGAELYRPRHYGISDYPFTAPGEVYSPDPLVLLDVVYHSVAAKWDFTVPGYHNYLCGGAIHHNSGKSHTSLAEAAAHALGQRLWLDKNDPHYDVGIKVPNKGLLMAESFDKVGTVLIAKLLGDPESGWPGMLPKACVDKTKKNQQGIINFIKLTNGSTMTFQSYDQDPKLFESSDYDYAVFDEPPPQRIWKAVFRGLTDRLGKAWLALTPLKEPWIKERLVDAEHVATFIFDITDNLGFGLTQQAIDEFARELDPDEARARLHGEFLHLQGLVYKVYARNEKIFRSPREKLLPKDRFGHTHVPGSWGLCMAIDPHPKTPHRALWATPRPDGNLIFCGILVNEDPDNLVSTFADDILAYEKDVLGFPNARAVDRLIDASSQINDPLSGNTIWDGFADKGIVCEIGTKDRDGCIKQTKERMRYDPLQKHFPTIFFCDDLYDLDKELKRYIWDEWMTRSGAQKTEKQVPRDKDDHSIENMHRIIYFDPQPPPVMGAEDDDNYRRDAGAMRTGY